MSEIALTEIDVERQVADCETFEETLEFRDRAMSAHVYAKAKNCGEEADIAKEAQLWAEWEAGGYLAEAPKQHGARPPDTASHLARPLNELGVSWDQSSRWQAVHKLSRELVRQHIADRRNNGKELTQAGLLQLAKKLDREQEIGEQRNEVAELPTGPFDVIVVDPPWPYGTKYDPQGRRAANPYPEMSLGEISALELPTSDDCIMWLWTTHRFMRDSFQILDIWGFRDVAILTWVKNRIGLGHWLRSNSEFCIMAVKGKPSVMLTNQSTTIYGDVREHSRKPDEFYEMVETLCPGSKMDYFSREPRPGWAQFGNETGKFNGT